MHITPTQRSHIVVKEYLQIQHVVKENCKLNSISKQIFSYANKKVSPGTCIHIKEYHKFVLGKGPVEKSRLLSGIARTEKFFPKVFIRE